MRVFEDLPNVVLGAKEFENFSDKKKFIAIGIFDGVHLGHRALVQRAVGLAKEKSGLAGVLTFNPHPSFCLQPDRERFLLSEKAEKDIIFKELGLDFVVYLNFNSAIASMSPVEFIEFIGNGVRNIDGIVVGNDWRFGKRRAGDVELLHKICSGEVESGALKLNENLQCYVVNDVESAGKLVKSTLIRKFLRQNNFSGVAKFLGREFWVVGFVEKGRGLGNQIGTPTLNIRYNDKKIPSNGVYAVKIENLEADDEQFFFGIANLGLRPSINESKKRRLLEIHLLDHDKNYHFRKLKITFLKFFRDEIKFSNVENLRTQIKKDVAIARKFIEKMKL